MGSVISGVELGDHTNVGAEVWLRRVIKMVIVLLLEPCKTNQISWGCLMKQILFVCNLFAPANHISAVRPTKISKYLGLYNDVSISVIAHSNSRKGVVDQILKDDISDTDVHVQYCENGKISKLIEFILEKYTILKKTKGNKTHNQTTVNASFDSNNSRNAGFRKTVFYLLTRILEWDRAKSLIKIIKRRKQQYDVVITFGPNCSDYVGRFLKRKVVTGLLG